MADGLLNADDLRELFDINSQLADARFSRALKAAGRRMREWVGDEAYDDALSEAPNDPERKEQLEYAEAHLAMGYAILGINTAMRPQGIVRNEALSEGGRVVTYHSPAEIEKLQEQYFETAELLARPYLLSDGTVDSFAGVATEDAAEGATRLTGCRC